MARPAFVIALTAMQTFALCDLTFEAPYFFPSAFPQYKKIHDKVLSIARVCMRRRESSGAVSSRQSFDSVLAAVAYIG